MRLKISLFISILSATIAAPSLTLAQLGALSLPTTASQTQRSELDAWKSAERSESASGYSDYLRSYPNGTFAALARTRSMPSILADMMPVAPEPDNYVVQVEMAAARKAWDETAWSRVKAANTHAAYREYLLHLPTGIHVEEATIAYRASLPAMPNVRVTQCEAPNQEATTLRRFDARNAFAFPDSAVNNWSDGIIIGTNEVDYTGAPLGFRIVYSSNLSMFGPTAQKFAAKMLYAPQIINCARVRDSAGVVVNYLAGDLPYESRSNAEGPPLQARLATRLDSELPADKAILIQFTPTAGTSVYELDVQSSFPPLLTQVVDGRPRPVPLVSNKMFVTLNDAPVTLRVSSRDKPNSRTQNKGRFRMQIRQVYNQP
jgi:hypothetical protein